MEAKIISAIAAAALVLFVFIAKRVVRLAIRLMLVGVIIMALLAAAAVGWWNGWFDTSSPQRPERPAPTRRAASR